MNVITIIGLGFEDGDLTIRAKNLINESEKVVVRTNKTKSFSCLKDYKGEIVSLDFVYEKSKNFNTLNKNLAKEILKLSKTEKVVYLVDGSATEDSSVKEILNSKAKVEIISGVSISSSCLAKLGESTTNVTTISAYDVLFKEQFSLPAIVYAIDDSGLASEIKLILSDLIGEECDCKIISGGKVESIKIYELDRLSNYDYSTCLYVKNSPLVNKQRFNYLDLIEILKVLRGENGCPWDKVQTPTSIEKNLIEECYELIDAIENNDTEQIIEEIGDVLLQTAFYVLFGEEDGSYTVSDVLSGVCLKLISRHTHVFGQDKASDSQSALANWNKNKIIEKGYETNADYLNAVPKNLPSVLRAQKVGSRAGKCNFDFDNVEQVFSKIYEEIEEIKSAIKSGNSALIEEECGDLLFSAVNVVRKLDVDGETSLYHSTDKFISRFKKLEDEVLKDGKDISSLTAKELDEYYNKVK